jgi:hypothetical protein
MIKIGVNEIRNYSETPLLIDLALFRKRTTDVPLPPLLFLLHLRAQQIAWAIFVSMRRTHMIASNFAPLNYLIVLLGILPVNH